MAKAEGAIARRIMEVAEEEGIPIMRNVPLARALFEQAEMNQYVPSDLLEPVARCCAGSRNWSGAPEKRSPHLAAPGVSPPRNWWLRPGCRRSRAG